MRRDDGTRQLREQLTTLTASLRAFDDPTVDDVPGLRLMRDTLRRRRAHIEQTIAKNETCAVELVLAGAGVRGEAVPATLLSDVLAAVESAVQQAAAAHVAGWDEPPAASVLADAVAMHVTSVEADEDVALLLTRRPGPLDAQLAGPDGVPVVEHAAAAVTAALRTATAGETGAAGEGLRSLAGVLAPAGVVLHWQLQPAVVDEQTVTVDAAGWQRLLRSDTG